MSRLANEMLNDPAFDDEPEVEILTLLPDTSDRVEVEYAKYMNPLGLVASDLAAVGWDSDDTGEVWFNDRYGACTFLRACKLEADRLNPPVEVENF